MIRRLVDPLQLDLGSRENLLGGRCVHIVFLARRLAARHPMTHSADGTKEVNRESFSTCLRAAKERSCDCGRRPWRGTKIHEHRGIDGNRKSAPGEPGRSAREVSESGFRKKTRSRHGEHLFRRIAQGLQAFAQGDRSERARRRARLSRNGKHGHSGRDPGERSGMRTGIFHRSVPSPLRSPVRAGTVSRFSG